MHNFSLHFSFVQWKENFFYVIFFLKSSTKGKIFTRKNNLQTLYGVCSKTKLSGHLVIVYSSNENKWIKTKIFQPYTSPINLSIFTQKLIFVSSRQKLLNTDFKVFPEDQSTPNNFTCFNFLFFPRQNTKYLINLRFLNFFRRPRYVLCLFFHTVQKLRRRAIIPCSACNTRLFSEENSMIFPQIFLCVGEWKCNFHFYSKLHMKLRLYEWEISTLYGIG